MPKKAFRQAIEAAEHLTLQEGLKAIKPGEGGGQIVPKDPRDVLGSVCIDDDCRAAFSNDARWDYVLGYGRSKKVVAHFVEVHSAEASEVSKLAAKLTWLRQYLEREAQVLLNRLPREIHWVASGRINIPRNTPQYRRLNVNLRKDGLRGPVKHLELA